MSITIKKITKQFENTVVLNNVSLDISTSQMVALLGPSGSGKTTLLRIIAGLDYQTSGQIYINEKNVSSLHARDRRVGFVFQNYALFRHMTVFENVDFGLTILPRHKRPSMHDIKKRVHNLLEIVQLSHLANRYPSQLSGGQKQRVALARALAVESQILLLDEPFGALDAQVRKELRRWLRELHKELKFTGVFVTHDQEEAIEVADTLVVMKQGNIEQVGTPDKVWREPQTRFVLEFLGEVNCFKGIVQGSYFYIDEHCWPLGYKSIYEGNVEIFLRPWEISLSREVSCETCWRVKIVDIKPRGHFWQLMVQPTALDQKPFSVVYNIQNISPTYGEYLFIGLKKARLYHGTIPLHQMKC
ncbi:sulfate/thiosulfate ABC transporter ATP-binding protein CysA [Candidatus Pantoea carbekii]|uniref:CysA protein n=1 Tax=Candidatus Pantoea carbekii TaxID=1235990 RepID=U3U626_9GAMM|nr:sulfate/thiosulfate ABC transporter ATP-binding protein CysA [Candidatus Pantoea carbekii]AKC31850.1 sulfate_thiosulfate import ATP-binding protein CysA [Candidatus Pantoea carbekii]BAO00360.1 CysA protein [Candidatus Pantoea carbekii]